MKNTLKNWIQRFYKSRTTPRVIQMENAECGAAALGIILGYYGKFVPLTELRKACATSRDGVSVEDMSLAAQYYGLEAEVFEASFEDLKETALPVILYWDFNHFVVLEGFVDGKVKINDPAMGYRTLTLGEVSKAYSGIIMECKPGKSFQPSGAKKSFFQRVKDKIKPFKRSVQYLFWVQLALALLGLAVPVFAQVFIDQFFGDLLPTWEWKFLLLFLGIIIFTSLMAWIQNIFLNFLQVRIAIDLSVKFLWKILRLPVVFFLQRYGSELINRMRLNNRIGEILIRNLALNLISFSLLLSYWAIMFFYNIPITLLAAGIALYNLGLIWYIGKVRRNAYAQLQQSEAKTVGVSFDALEHIETMKGNANEGFFFSRISSSYTENFNNAQEISKKDIWLSTLSKFSEQFSTVVLLGFGSYEIIVGALSVGKLIAIQILYKNFLNPVQNLVTFSTEAQSVDVDLTRLDDVLEENQDPFLDTRKPEAIQDSLKGNIEFQKVDFGYKPLHPPFIENLSIEFHPGEMIAITGPTGSGKTTFAKLITCLLQPRNGKILYDGKSYQEFTQETIRNSIGLVDQIIQLFPGTIRENLTLWNTFEANDETIIEASKTACIHRDIIQLPEGYSYQLEEEGTNFSAGQCQRLEIARILLKKPSIIILDEATSSIDAETEIEILKNIHSLKITTVIISHRLNTFKFCDRILVMESGKIIQDGTHEALSQTPGLYRALLEFEIKKKL